MISLIWLMVPLELGVSLTRGAMRGNGNFATLCDKWQRTRTHMYFSLWQPASPWQANWWFIFKRSTLSQRVLWNSQVSVSCSSATEWYGYYYYDAVCHAVMWEKEMILCLIIAVGLNMKNARLYIYFYLLCDHCAIVMHTVCGCVCVMEDIWMREMWSDHLYNSVTK